MDDERLMARLRAAGSAGEPRPAFVDELHADLAARLGLQPAVVASQPRQSSASRLLLLAATIALLLALAAGAVLIGSSLHLIKLPSSMLQTIRDDGAVRVAVRSDAPQASTVSASLDGFDVEVARYVGVRLGVQTHLVPTSSSGMLEPASVDWQVGMPSQLLTQDEQDRFAVADAYYAWPIYLVTAQSSVVRAAAGLAGQPICATAGSPAELWLRGGAGGAAPVALQPAPPATVHLLADDHACLDDVRQGGSAAMVTSQLLLSDLTSTPDVRVVGGGPVAYERRAMIVPRAAIGEDELVAELNRIIHAARLDGSLTRLSQEWFGGQDLTVGLP
jgi:ABC-type amino acid transport substrate-binding protein